LATASETAAVGIACAAHGGRIADLLGLPRAAKCGVGNAKGRAAAGGIAKRNIGTTAERYVVG